MSSSTSHIYMQWMTHTVDPVCVMTDQRKQITPLPSYDLGTVGIVSRMGVIMGPYMACRITGNSTHKCLWCIDVDQSHPVVGASDTKCQVMILGSVFGEVSPCSKDFEDFWLNGHAWSCKGVVTLFMALLESGSAWMHCLSGRGGDKSWCTQWLN